MTRSAKSRESSITRDQSVNQAFQTILRQNFQVMTGWEPVAYHRSDIEGVHQVRVALRRMRSALVVFRRALPRTLTDPMGDAMRWAAGELGAARDLDVFISEGLDLMAGRMPLDAEIRKLRARAMAAQEVAYGQVRALLDSGRYRSFRDSFGAWVEQGAWYQQDLPGPVRARLMDPVPGFAVRALDKHHDRVLASGAPLSTMGANQLHELRIECKKLRYAVEFFAPLFDAEGMGRYTGYLKGLQGVLGTINDVSLLPGLLERLVGDQADPDLIRCAGATLGWRSREAEQARVGLAKQWKAFSRAGTPWRSPVGEETVPMNLQVS
ncbi:MAG: CHAD domain-containing protein [Magnetococcales bacterium]|nr:CHAD domain-containing protein [Magnetococcales bacterium]